MINELTKSASALASGQPSGQPSASAQSSATSVPAPETTSLIDLVKSGKIHDIEKFIDNSSNIINQNEPIKDNDKSGTYLDFAADRVMEGCHSGLYIWGNTKCIANIEIYSYLKKNRVST